MNSLRLTTSDRPAPVLLSRLFRRVNDLRFLVVLWLTVVSAIVISKHAYPTPTPIVDPDAQMRLVILRDLAAGQGWFDSMAHRLGPDGLVMHWSRLIDGVLLVLLRLGEMIGLGPAAAERVATFGWPSLQFFLLFAASRSVALVLGGPGTGLASAASALITTVVLGSFQPGSIDHHNIQILLLVFATGQLMRFGNQPSAALWLGLAVIAMTVIGLETALHVGVLCTIAFFLWAQDPRPLHRQALALFGVTLAAIAPLAYFGLSDPRNAMSCDIYSLFYMTGLLGSGMALMLSALLSPAQIRQRWALGIALMVCVALIALWVNPDCARGPMPLAPELVSGWFNEISEMRPLGWLFWHSPAAALGVSAPVVAGLGFSLWQVWRGPEATRGAYAIHALLTALCCLVSLVHVRAVPFAMAMGQLGLAQAYVRFWPSWPVTRRALAQFLCLAVLSFPPLYPALGALLHLPGISFQDTKATAGLSSAEAQCRGPDYVRALSRLPDGLVLAPLFFGPTILEESRNAVFSGPYHRAGQNILDAMTAFGTPEAAARALVQRWPVRFVVMCVTSGEVDRLIQKDKASFAAALAAGQTPDWLTEIGPSVDAPANIKIYRVTDGARD